MVQRPKIWLFAWSIQLKNSNFWSFRYEGSHSIRASSDAVHWKNLRCVRSQPKMPHWWSLGIQVACRQVINSSWSIWSALWWSTNPHAVNLWTGLLQHGWQCTSYPVTSFTKVISLYHPLCRCSCHWCDQFTIIRLSPGPTSIPYIYPYWQGLGKGAASWPSWAHSLWARSSQPCIPQIDRGAPLIGP